MKTLIIDMETTGLEPRYNDVWNIAWLVIEDNKVVKFRDRYYPIRRFGYDYWKFSLDYKKDGKLIYPQYYKVNRKHHWTEDKELIKDVMNADVIVGHHVEFEMGFLELIVPDVWKKAQYCTMNMTTYVCKLQHSKYIYKWPKLQEAYILLIYKQRLTGLERFIPGHWHVAKFDVFTTMRVYEYMTQTKLFVQPWIWIQAGVIKGYLQQLKNTMDFKLWILKSRVDSQLGKLKNNILRTVFKKDGKDGKDEEEIPF